MRPPPFPSPATVTNDSYRYFWTTPTQIFSKQSGVVRTNCIDCLDRTNVVQSAISRSMLMSLLVNLGVTSQEQVGMHDELDLAFK